ncbi:MBL fold metallo-hydrolase [Desulfobacter curvatus]|uniref:MBL fold metallo-hydrolase n=1 Tax=Desulfobacter curvatus TaxID=2290 RepID=UPI000364F397|nr:MBL fold metallo-hydrolase [Desulfobacter curvatus]
MNIKFWGSRGSIPISLSSHDIEHKLAKALQMAGSHNLSSENEISRFIKGLPFSIRGTFGSNTSCVQVEGEDKKQIIICDSGTGIRDLGTYLATAINRDGPQNFAIHIFISHLHWDHISGFPFFIPAFMEGCTINFYGYHDKLEESMTFQQNFTNFPVPLSAMGADITFKVLEIDQTYEIGGFSIKGIKQNHPGDAFGFRFEQNHKAFVYSTDSEHYDDVDRDDYPFVKFFNNADLVVFDAQYKFAETLTCKKDWGHSSSIIGIELALRSGVKRLCLFHNDPASCDENLEQHAMDAQKYARHCPFPGAKDLEVFTAYDGLEINI